MIGRVLPVEWELKREFVLAGARALIKKNFIVVIEEDGLGEAAGSIHYGITPDDLESELSDLLGLVRETPERDLDAVLLAQQNRFSRPAVCAVSTALHDYRARRSHQPLYEHLGLGRPGPLKTSVTVSIGDAETLAQYSDGDWAAVKIKMDADPIRAGQIIEAMHRLPNRRFRIDANGSWKLDDAVRIIAEMPSERMDLIEQPFSPDAVDDWLRLRETTIIPLFADETIETAGDVARAAGYADGVNIKIQKSGRLETAIEAMRAAKTLGLKIMLGCMIESSVGIAAAWHLSSPADYIDLDGRYLITGDHFRGLAYEHGIIGLAGEQGHGISFA
jgi:L-alanine-DL-glutamate epimerase-like enolase superfamily enzyme